MPVISNLVFTKTASTIVATWDTDSSSDSNLFVNGQAALDNGAAANRTTGHQCVKAGLLPSTTYSCFVTSGGTSSTPQNVTTNALDTRILVTNAKNGAVTLGSQTNNFSDTQRTFKSNDGIVYVTQDDGKGITAGLPESPGLNTQLGALTDEVAMTGTTLALTNYGNFNTTNGTDGPLTDAMTNKSSGIFGLNGNLHMFVYRQYPPNYTTNRYCNWIKSTDHGVTWNNFNDKSTFTAGGNPVTPNSPSEPIQFYDKTIGLVTPVLYAADDGTLGYNTAGNLIDGGNAYVYMVYLKDNDLTTLYLMRLPRIQFDAQNAAPMQYWAGPAFPSPLDFVKDSNWSSSPAAAVSIKPSFPVSANLNQSVWYQPVFVPAINSYLLHTSGYYNGNPSSPNGIITIVYAGATPAGPWRLIYTQVNSALNKWWSGVFPFHRDVAANVATHDIAIKTLFSGNPGGSFYQINYSTLTLLPASGAEMIQLAQCAFTTIENPLSFGGNFSTQPGGYVNLQVPSSGVCETTSNSGNALMLWTGAIPSGDTGGTWPADQYSEITVGQLNNIATDNQYATVRASNSANTFYLLLMAATTAAPSPVNCNLYAFTAGTSHLLATFALTIAANDVMRLSITGNILTVTQNGTTVQTFTDTNNFIASGSPGLGTIAATVANSKISNWAAGANQAAAPTFSPVGGSYNTPQTVTITGPGGSTIYYTTDGTTPTRSSSSIASGASISVNSSETVKAISSATNFADSQVAGATYTISSGGGGGIGGGGSKKSFNFKLKL